MDTNLVIKNEILGELSDKAFEAIQNSLEALGLTEPVVQAICDLADAHAMLNMRIAGGSGSVGAEDLGSSVSNIIESLDILDKACQEHASMKITE